MAAEPQARVAAVVLAGGQGRRMGGQDKGLLPWQGRALIDWMLDALRAQQGLRLAALAISANRNEADYGQRGLPLLRDAPAHAGMGPLAGLVQALEFAQQQDCLLTWILPCDAPLLPPTLGLALLQAQQRSGAPAVVPALAQADGSLRWHGAHALLCSALAPALRRMLEGGERRLQVALQGLGAQALLLPAKMQAGFANLNRPEDLAAPAPR